MEEEVLKLPIAGELNIQSTKKALKKLEDMTLGMVGKVLKVENEKLIDAQKKLYLGFARVGRGKNARYASFTYQKDAKGKLKGVPSFATYTRGDKKGQLRTLTPKQALSVYDSNTETQYRRALSDTIIKRSGVKKKDLKSSSKQNDKKVSKNISGFTKMLNTFKRVGFYRIARRSFQLIEQGFSQGLENIAKFSPEMNKTLSSMTSQFTILSNSLATILVPLLKTVEPILKPITKIVANMASVLSYFIAKLAGSATYLKANTEYMSDFNDQVNKFSFDKFESLNPEDKTGNMFIESKVEDGLTSELEEAKGIIDAIGVALIGFGVIKFVKWLLDNKLSDTVKDVKKIKDSLTTTSALQFTGFTTMLTIMGTVLAGIGTFKLFDWLLEDATKAQSVLITLLGVVLALATAFTFVRSLALGNVAGAMASAIGVGAGLGILVAGAKNWAQKSVETYANGGMVERGSLFIAGESGAEFVTQMPSGQTGVTNIAQFKQATLEALYSWWSDARDDLPDGGSFNLDGAQIARSKNFIAEINRKNVGLNLK